MGLARKHTFHSLLSSSRKMTQLTPSSPLSLSSSSSSPSSPLGTCQPAVPRLDRRVVASPGEKTPHISLFRNSRASHAHSTIIYPPPKIIFPLAKFKKN